MQEIYALVLEDLEGRDRSTWRLIGSELIVGSASGALFSTWKASSAPRWSTCSKIVSKAREISPGFEELPWHVCVLPAPVLPHAIMVASGALEDIEHWNTVRLEDLGLCRRFIEYMGKLELLAFVRRKARRDIHSLNCGPLAVVSIVIQHCDDRAEA